MSEVEALNYVRPSAASFWRWGDGGRVLEWADGKTIAFLGELHVAAAHVARRGLPPLGCLALALAAMRNAWRQDPAQRGMVAGYMQAALSRGTMAPGDLTKLLGEALLRLDALAALPEELRRNPESRGLLVEMLFEGVPSELGAEEAAGVVALLGQRVPEFDPSGIPLAVEHAAEAEMILKTLAACRMLTNPEAIAVRVRTGLEQTPAASKAHISELARGLLNSLRGDPELAALAKLARAVLAVVATPRRLRPQMELPLGGFSDVTNRGPLDRLLLTELAHDDLTLAVRVALNEALYLRRESPRTPQRFTRVLLLDAGIRMWGVQRVFAMAVALALAASTPKEAQLIAVAACGKALIPVDLGTREGLLAHLGQLDPAPHPGAAMSALAKSVETVAEKRSETILITHPDVRADREFQQALDAAGLYPLMAATVAGTGQFELTAISAAGHKPLARAMMSLDEVMAPASDVPPLIAVQDDLPAIFRLFSSPFRLPLMKDMSRAAASRLHGLLGIVQRTLVHWPLTGRARHLMTVPNGDFLGLGVFEDEATAVTAVWDPLDKLLHLSSAALGLQQRVVHQRVRTLGQPLALAGHQGVILAIGRERVEGFTCQRCVKIGTLEFPGFCRHVGSRFLEGASGKVLAIAYDGGLSLVDVPLPTSPLLVFTRFGYDGPLGLYPEGSIHDTHGRVLVDPTFWASSALRYSPQVSEDGNRLIVSVPTTEGPRTLGIDLSQPEPKWSALKDIAPRRFLLGSRADYALDMAVHLRRNMLGVAVVEGDLALISRRNKTLVLQSRDGHYGTTGAYRGGRLHRIFKPVEKSLYGLQLAVWGDGSRAWLDPRGMLHLRSGAPTLPELSLLLCQSGFVITAWSSHGRTYGLDYLLEEKATGELDELLAYLRAFVGRLT